MYPPLDTINPPAGPDLSVVLPVHNEAANLPELVARLRRTLDRSELRYELVFVDDGSTDASVSVLADFAETDRRIRVLVLSRNFGQHVAATAGIDVATGAMVLWMDSDLQERPEDIPKLVAKFHEGFDVVYTRRVRRRQTPLRAWASHAFMHALNRVGRLNVTPDRACMRLFSAQVAAEIRRFRERSRFMGYLMPYAGFRSAEIDIEIDDRRHGRTNYTWAGLLRHAITGLTSFSAAPLRLSAVMSLVTFLACLGGIGWVVFKYFAWGVGVSGWSSLIIAVLLLHAVEFAILAIIGEYVGQTYLETKQRPLYICARAINLERHEARTPACAERSPTREPMVAGIDWPEPSGVS